MESHLACLTPRERLKQGSGQWPSLEFVQEEGRHQESRKPWVYEQSKGPGPSVRCVASLAGAGVATGTRLTAPVRQTAICLGPVCHQKGPLHLHGG